MLEQQHFLLDFNVSFPLSFSYIWFRWITFLIDQENNKVKAHQPQAITIFTSLKQRRVFPPFYTNFYLFRKSGIVFACLSASLYDMFNVPDPWLSAGWSCPALVQCQLRSDTSICQQIQTIRVQLMEGWRFIKHPSEWKMHFGYLACLRFLPCPRAVEMAKKIELFPPPSASKPEFGLFEQRVCKKKKICRIQL